MINAALIGYGYWGCKVTNALLNSRLFTLTHICDTSHSALQAAVDNCGSRVTITTSSANIMDCDTVDAVIICTPPASHYQLCEEALRRIKHVWVEKPFCTNDTQAKRIIETARFFNRTVFPDFTYLYNPLFRLMRDIIRANGGASSVSVESSRCNCNHCGTGHSVLADLAVHDFSILHFLFADRMHNCTPMISLTCASPEKCSLSLIAGDVSANILVDWTGREKVRDFLVRSNKLEILYSVDSATNEETLQVRGKRDTPDQIVTSSNMNGALTTACKSFGELIANQEQDLELLKAALFSHECLKYADGALRKVF